MYTKNIIEKNIPDFSRDDIRLALYNHAYLFSNGPFRDCWVRYGYDPRLYPEARQFQVVDMRKYMARRTPIVQVCDLDESVKRVLENPLFWLDEFDVKDGWFTREGMAAVKESFKRFGEGMDEDDQDILDEVLRDMGRSNLIEEEREEEEEEEREERGKKKKSKMANKITKAVEQEMEMRVQNKVDELMQHLQGEEDLEYFSIFEDESD